MIIEYGNAIACRFNVSKRQPQTLAILDGFVCEMHAKMVNDGHADLNTVFAFRDDTHPLRVKAKGGLKLPRKVRPESAPVKRAVAIGVPAQKWTEEVTDAARQLGEVSGRHGETFKSVIRQEVRALTYEEKEAQLLKQETFNASVAGSTRGGASTSRGGGQKSQERPQSGTSRASYRGLPTVKGGRPESGHTAKSAPNPGVRDRRMKSAGGRPSTAQPTSFRPMSAARREKEGGRRPFSAVSHMSQLTEATEGTEGYDAIMVDDDYADEDEYIGEDAGSEGGSTGYPGSNFTTGSVGSHPASFQSGRYFPPYTYSRNPSLEYSNPN